MPKKGSKISEETRRKMSLAHKGKVTWIKGRKHSLQTKKKMSDSAKTSSNFMRGRFGESSPNFGRKHRIESLAKMRLSKLKNPVRFWLNKRRSEETKTKISLSKKGKKLSVSHLAKLKESAKRGDRHWNWRDGVTSDKKARNWTKNKRNRTLKRMKILDTSHTFAEWECLKRRYNNVCLCCGAREADVKLTEDHIIPLIKGGSDLIENIQPLCLKCNLRKHTKIINFTLMD